MNKNTLAQNCAKNLVNHITFVLDESGSMTSIKDAVIQLFDDQVASLCEDSKKNNQETRVSVFKFNTDWHRRPIIDCVIFDTDVLRVPSIRKMYSPQGATPMITGVTTAINSLCEVPEIFGDHAHMMFVITDGQETEQYNMPSAHNALKQLIAGLGDNWTVGCLVPNDRSQADAVRFGFSDENCFKWSQTAKGVQAVNKTLKSTTKAFFTARASGQRSIAGSMFKVDLSKIDKNVVQKTLSALPFTSFKIEPVTTSSYKRIPTAQDPKDIQIRPFVQNVVGETWVKGNAFYQLTKTEEVQDYKEVCVRDTRNGLVYTGADARGLIGLPTSGKAKIKPEGSGTYEIYIQSTSINRKLVPGTKFIYKV